MSLDDLAAAQHAPRQTTTPKTQQPQPTSQSTLHPRQLFLIGFFGGLGFGAAQLIFGLMVMLLVIIMGIGSCATISKSTPPPTRPPIRGR